MVVDFLCFMNVMGLNVCLIKMKKYFLASLGVILFFSCKNEILKPKLVLETDILLLDTLVVNIETEHKIWIENQGNANLEIQKIESSCGCTIGKINDSIIKPDSKTELSFTIIPEFSGEFSKNIVIRSNDSIQFHIIKLKGFVKENN